MVGIHTVTTALLLQGNPRRKSSLLVTEVTAEALGIVHYDGFESRVPFMVVSRLARLSSLRL